MAIKYGFFDSVDGDRKYSAEEIGRYLHGLVSSGVYADSSASMQVLAGTGMELQVGGGRAMLDGYYMELDDVEFVTLSEGSAQRRIDAIVARLDKTRRLCEIAVLEGTPGTTPAVPTVKRSETVKEYMLAYVEIPALAVTITQDQVYDTRADKTVCGWVTGIINQVDTTALYTQWETAYKSAYERFTTEANTYLTEKRTEFDAFMATLTGDLQVQTYIQEYANAVTADKSTNAIYIGIDEFDPDIDVLFVNVRGLTYPKTDYKIMKNVTSGTISSGNLVTGHQVLLLYDRLAAGDVIEFRVLKSKIGIAPTT